jgi:hypothetical protein
VCQGHAAGRALNESDMPVIRGIPLSLETGEVLRRAGFGSHSGIRSEIKSLVSELLASVEDDHLLEPAVAREIYPLAEAGDSVLSSLLPEAKEVAIVVGTIGSGLEKQVTDYSNMGEPLRGVLLDGIGSAAVDSLAQEACNLVADEASSRGYRVGSPINPGMPGLPIVKQRQLLEMVPSREIGVSLTSSGMMVPRKSVSMVIGVGPQMHTWTRAEVCARCSLKQTCPHRIRA